MNPFPKSLRRPQGGQSTVEYTIVLAVAVMVLVVSTGGSTPIDQLLTAIKTAYRGYLYAINWSTVLTIP
jgi:hypothetical protein